MEARKITIVSTKTQTKSVIMSTAETLGQLKSDLAEANIDYTDMTFYEGLTKTELKSDDSVLPKDVPYTNRATGVTINTNELVFMLTNTNKKIKSGASRQEVYKMIKDNNLEEACINKYFKNFTQCSTKDLLDLIEKHKQNTINTIEEVVSEGNQCNCVDMIAREAIKKLISVLYSEELLDSHDKCEVLSILKEEGQSLKSSYDDSEIDSMFEDMLN